MQRPVAVKDMIKPVLKLPLLDVDSIERLSVKALDWDLCGAIAYGNLPEIGDSLVPQVFA
jgi:hypothetical protein